MGWLTNYEYRKKITLTGSISGGQTNYQILLDVPKALTMQDDFRDIRFTKSNGFTEIDAWAEVITSGVSAKIWVKFPTTPADTDTEVYYMYYNNPIAVSNWDADSTFIVGDDFVGQTSLDTTKWVKTGTVTVGSNYARLNNTISGGSSISSIAAHDFAQPVTVIQSVTMSYDGCSTVITMTIPDRNGVIATVGCSWVGCSCYRRFHGVTNNCSGNIHDSPLAGTSRHEITVKSPDSIQWICSGSRNFNKTLTIAGNYPTCSTRYVHFAAPYNGVNRNLKLNWIIITKYVSDPATYAFGPEEEEIISVSVPRWTVYFDGNHQTGIQSVDVLTTIAGSSKAEIVLSDVSNLNNIEHFADIEIWSGANDTIDCGLIFDGVNDYVELANTVELNPNDWAISWWMKRDVRTKDVIFAETKNGSDGFLQIYGSFDALYFESHAGTWFKTFQTGLTISDGEWHHYVLNFTSTESDIYIDGIFYDSEDPNTDTNNFEINLFGYEQTAAPWFEGSLAHVMIFDESIDATEVDNLYSGFYTVKPKVFLDLSQSTAVADAIYDRMEYSHGTSYTDATTAGALTVDTSPVNQFIVFKGRVDLLLPDYDTDTLSITGRDYLSDLLSRACVESYTTKLRSYIVNDVVLKYGTSMSRNHIEASPASTEISYLFKTDAWSSIVKCATEDAYKFFCDTDKDFHYIPKGWNNSGVTITVGSSDVLGYNIIEQDSDIINRVIVYGYDDGVDQVIVQADDLDSQDSYGVINEKKLIDTELLTEAAAEDFAYSYLEDHSIVLEIIELDIIGNETLTPGDMIRLVIPDLNIDSDHLIIDKILKYPDNVTTIRVAKDAKNLEAILSSMIEKILSLESQFMDSGSDILKLFRVNEAVLYTDRITVEKKPATLDAHVVGLAVVGVDRVGSRGTGIWEEIYDSGY